MTRISPSEARQAQRFTRTAPVEQAKGAGMHRGDESGMFAIERESEYDFETRMELKQDAAEARAVEEAELEGEITVEINEAFDRVLEACDPASREASR